MLVLSRKVGERIRIGDQVTVTVVRLAGGAVRLGVEAPADMLVVREELLSEAHRGSEATGEDRGAVRPQVGDRRSSA